MNRLEYMRRLEELLMDISSDDRKDALQYYEDYFDEAGFENEDKVIRELGTPELLSKGIKDGLFNGGAAKEGGFTEHGYDDPDDSRIRYAVAEKSSAKEKEPEPEIVLDMEPKEEPSKNTGAADADPFAEYERRVEEDWKNRYEEERRYEEQRRAEQEHRYEEEQRAKQEQRMRYEQDRRFEEEQRLRQEQQRYDNRYPNPGYDYDNERRPRKKGHHTFWILFGIFGFPIWFPILITAVSLVFAAIVTAGGLMLGVGVGAAACLVGGVAGIGLGVTRLFIVPATGIIMCGGGIAAIGAGLLLLAATVAIITKLIPALARGMAAVCQAPFRRGRA